MNRRTMLLAGLLAVAFRVDAQVPEDESAVSSRLAELLGADSSEGFARALEPRVFSFPADHGPHPEFRNEWWYITGNLDSSRDLRFGFELTVFRFSLSPDVPQSPSGWRTNQVYIAHLALTDVNGREFYVAQRYSRGALGLAGARSRPFRVWLEDWEIAAGAGEGEWKVSAKDDHFGVELSLVALRKPVLNGEAGLSRKSPQPGNASYYYSIPRLETSGTIRVGDTEHQVSGLSWLDREWSTSALDADQVGWDWFALQLSDGNDLMFYGLRERDGSRHPSSAGTWMPATGDPLHLDSRDVEIEVVDEWASPRGGTYPARWRVSIPRLEIDLEVAPVLADQELSTTVRYWEGAVDVNGQRQGRPVTGRGYVELTGYAEQEYIRAEPGNR